MNASPKHASPFRLMTLGTLALTLWVQTAVPAQAQEPQPKALPEWYSNEQTGRMGNLDARAYLEEAVRLQQLGETAAIAALKERSKQEGLQVIVLCRMLFVARQDAAFRAPNLGWGSACQRVDKGDWPLDPIALVDGIPFLVSPRYHSKNREESAAEYLDWCLEHCDWNPVRHVNVDKAAAEQALNRLMEQVGGTRKGTWKLHFAQQLAGWRQN